MVGMKEIQIENINYINREFLESLLSVYNFTAEKKIAEEDGLVILCLDEIEFLISWGTTEDEALIMMAKDILGYAEDYYNDFAQWSRGNGKLHIPYILKALMMNDVQKIKESIICRLGEI